MNNDEFIKYIVIIKCRICFYSKNEKANLDFDVIAKKRYY